MPSANEKALIEQITGQLETLNVLLEQVTNRLKNNGLCCAECGAIDDGRERGWTLRLDVDDETVAFCRECDRREFGDA
jgi:hypothetical protein